jgi:hypothetical protein
MFRTLTSRCKRRTLVVAFALACAAPATAAPAEFAPGVTDVPSHVRGVEAAETFVPGVTDVPNAFASAKSAKSAISKRMISTDGAMPRAMPYDYSAAGVQLPTPRVPATVAPAVDRFDWRDAGVGAAIAVVALALAAGAGLLGRSRVLVARSRAQGAH